MIERFLSSIKDDRYTYCVVTGGLACNQVKVTIMSKHFRILAASLTAVVGLVPYAQAGEPPASSDPQFGKLSWDLGEHTNIGHGLLVETWTRDAYPSPVPIRPMEIHPSYTSPLRISTRITMNLNRYGALFGYVGRPGEPAFGTSVYEHALFEEEVRAGAREHWLDPAGSSDETVTAGYAWRGMKIEGSAFRSHNGDGRQDASFKPFGLTSGRLSFRSGGNWAFQASRRRNNRLDEIEGADPERRTTVSATYHRLWDAAEWKTTFAAGRLTSGDGKSPSHELLCESVITLQHAHTLFARWERAAAADIFNQDERLRDQAFKAQKMTFGYVYDIILGSKNKLDIGVIGSRGASLSPANDIYNENRRSYKVFTRLTMPY